MAEEKIFGFEGKEPTVSRRGFVKWSSILGGTLAISGNVEGFVKSEATAAQKKAGEWIPASCWPDCGSKGFNKVYVEDGVIIRSGTDDTVPDNPDNPQLRSCPKGRANRQRILGPDRLKYPMKRKNWAPGGGKKDLRGRDEWERISWNEALDILASETKRIVKAYGNTAIYQPTTSGGMPYTEMARTLNLYGGYVSDWGSNSSGSWHFTGPVIGMPRGRDGTGEDMNDFMDLRKSDLVVLWGFNPAWSRMGMAMYELSQIKKAGAKFVTVDPLFNPTAAAMGVTSENWYPCRPATDHALVLGLMHTLLVEDDPKKNPLIRWDYLNKYTVGFDAEHMPENADKKENLKDYLLGTYDKTPKNAQWAGAICSIPPEKIKSLAREIAKTKNVALLMSPAPSRVNNADNWPQAIMTLAMMTGHIGTPGNVFGSDAGHGWLVQGRALLNGGTYIGWARNFPEFEPIPNPTAHTRVNCNELWNTIITKKYTASDGTKKDINLQMLYFARTGRMNQNPGAVKAIQAVRSVEFVVSQDSYFTTNCKFADLVLPITTQWERPGDVAPGYRGQILYTSQVLQPLFEAKDDVYVARELGARLGLDPERIQPYSKTQEVFNMVAASKIWDADANEYKHLVTITEDDIKKRGVKGAPQKGVLPIAEFQKKGIYHSDRKPDDKNRHIVLEDFINDPVKNKLDTPSGKLEIHCQKLADRVNSIGFSKIKPIPTYITPVEGYEDTFKDWNKKIKGDFPLQLLNFHPPRQAHTMFYNTPWLRESFDHLAMLNPLDAKTYGISEGDTLLVSSRHGRMLRNVTLTETIRPGVLAMGHGNWLDWDDELKLDKGGCVNILCGGIATGQGHQGWGSCNVKVEKWTGAPLPSDRTKPLSVVKLANVKGEGK